MKHVTDFIHKCQQWSIMVELATYPGTGTMPSILSQQNPPNSLGGCEVMSASPPDKYAQPKGTCYTELASSDRHYSSLKMLE